MEKGSFTIPGTTIQVGGFVGSLVSDGLSLLTPLLGLGTGLLLSQITHIADNLSKETVQNWVKRSYVDPPRKGRFYDGDQVARILIFNSLRSVMELDEIRLLLDCVQEFSGGTLREKELLEVFHQSVVKTKHLASGDLAGYEKTIGPELALRFEKKGGNREKIKQVVYIMLTAYQSSQLKQQAEQLLLQLKQSLRG